MLTLIAAQDLAGAIGRANAIPWHVPEDFAFFKRETTGGAVIMGRKTWDSLPRKPLPDRLNIVVTREMRENDGPVLFTGLESAIPRARAAGYDRIYCIGGGEIYRLMLPMAERILLSTVSVRIDDADTFFPRLDPEEWHETGREILRAADPTCIVTCYRRRTA